MLVSSPGSTPTSAPARWPARLGTAAVAIAFTAAVLAVALPWPQIFSGTGADATEGRNAAANDAALIRANNVLDDRDWSRRAENAAARRLLEDTLARNPGDAEAWASLGLTYWQEVRHLTWGGGRREMRQALSMAERSMALEPTPRAHRLLAEMRLLAPFEDMRDPLDALAAATAAVQMDPRDPDSLAVLAMVRALGGDAETAVGLIERARRLNPGAPARAAEELRPLHAPDAPVHARAWSGWLLAASLAQAGRRDEAAEIVAAAVRRRPELSLDMVAHSLDGFYRPETREPVLEGLRLAGLPG
jgi:tetratricopeptide (TPR) repeat protein